MRIELRARLSAYTRAALPTKTSDLQNDSGYITDVPEDSEEKMYARIHGEWVEINGGGGDNIELEDDSGLSLRREGGKAYLGLDRWIGDTSSMPSQMIDERMYYGYDDLEQIVQGGSAYDYTEEDNDWGEEYQLSYTGGSASTEAFSTYFKPLEA